jgi:hypothetical protein
MNGGSPGAILNRCKPYKKQQNFGIINTHKILNENLDWEKP